MKYVSLPSDAENLKKNLFLTNSMFGFVWMNFHFTIIFFFWIILQSALLVWLFLWLWALVALFFDIPLGTLQKYFKPKSMFIAASLLMLIVWLIFFKFIFIYSIVNLNTWDWLGVITVTESLLSRFMNDFINIILLLVAWICYWIIKELFDITNLSYIMNNSDPSEYWEMMSKSCIFYWWWAFAWLLISWALLTFSPQIAVMALMVFILLFILFAVFFFDNPNTNLIDNIQNLRLVSFKDHLQKIKDYTKEKIQVAQANEIISNWKAIFIKPLQPNSKIDFSELVTETIAEFKNTFNVLFKPPISTVLLWILLLIILFWFRDTFVATFQISFLDKLLSINQDTIIIKQTSSLINWYILLALLVIPAFTTQLFFIKLSKNIWVYLVLIFWTLLSWMSIINFWLSNSIFLTMMFWIMNSMWYAAVMPIAQPTFSEYYNIEHSKKNNLSQINSNAAAWPLKIILNFANVIWLLFWGMFIALMWFNSFFVAFWLFILTACLIWLIFHKKILKVL